jgi:hypothetical protein
VEDLHHIRIGQKGLEVRGVIVSPVQLNQMGIALAVRDLDDAEGIAPETQTHGLRIDRHAIGLREEAGGQITDMKMVSQVATLRRYDCPSI